MEEGNKTGQQTAGGGISVARTTWCRCSATTGTTSVPAGLTQQCSHFHDICAVVFFFFILGLCPDFWYHPLIRVKTREVLFIANVPTSGTIPCSNIVQTFGAKFFHRTSRLEATLAQRPEHPVTYPITVTLTNPVRVNATSRLQIKPGLGRTQFEVKVKDKVI